MKTSIPIMIGVRLSERPDFLALYGNMIFEAFRPVLCQFRIAECGLRISMCARLLESAIHNPHSAINPAILLRNFRLLDSLQSARKKGRSLRVVPGTWVK